VAPTEYISDAHSGPTRATVPRGEGGSTQECAAGVKAGSSRTEVDIDKPKSPIFTVPSGARKQLEGLTSRCRIPTR